LFERAANVVVIGHRPEQRRRSVWPVSGGSHSWRARRDTGQPVNEISELLGSGEAMIALEVERQNRRVPFGERDDADVRRHARRIIEPLFDDARFRRRAQAAAGEFLAS
jgi:hypothetical protein